MANFQSYQIQMNTPRASHGMGGNEKVEKFEVVVPITASTDTIEFGYLPANAVITGAEIISSATASLDVGVPGDADGIFDGITLAANVPQRTVLSTLLGKNLGEEEVKVSGVCNGAGTAGRIILILRYIVEEQGVAYSYTPAP